MAKMCETGSAYFDARTGGTVGALPPTTAPVLMRSPDGWLVTAASLRGAHEAVITRSQAIVDQAVDNV